MLFRIIPARNIPDRLCVRMVITKKKSLETGEISTLRYATEKLSLKNVSPTGMLTVGMIL